MKKTSLLLFMFLIATICANPSYAELDFDSLMGGHSSDQQESEEDSDIDSALGLDFGDKKKKVKPKVRESTSPSSNSVDAEFDNIHKDRNKLRTKKAYARLVSRNRSMERDCKCSLDGEACEAGKSYDNWEDTNVLSELISEIKAEKKAECLKWQRDIVNSMPDSLDGINKAIKHVNTSLTDFIWMDSRVSNKIASLDRKQKEDRKREEKERQARVRKEEEERIAREEQLRRERENQERAERQKKRGAFWTDFAQNLNNQVNNAAADLATMKRRDNELKAQRREANRQKQLANEERQRRARESQNPASATYEAMKADNKRRLEAEERERKAERERQRKERYSARSSSANKSSSSNKSNSSGSSSSAGYSNSTGRKSRQEWAKYPHAACTYECKTQLYVQPTDNEKDAKKACEKGCNVVNWKYSTTSGLLRCELRGEFPDAVDKLLEKNDLSGYEGYGQKPWGFYQANKGCVP